VQLTNVTGLPVSWTMGFQRDGREMLVVVVKATYTLPQQGEDAQLAEDQVPLIEADRFSGEPGMSAPTFETDYAHRKPLCDILLVGSAYAPPGRRALRTRVGLKVGSWVKQFDVVGPRVWRKGVFGIAASDPEPFETIPLIYDNAFGGTDRTEAAKGRTATFLANPVGKGFRKHTDAIDGQPLPNTEEIGRPVEKYDGQYTPQALSPIGRNWMPRLTYAGTYDQAWIENTAPLWPTDFDERYFQSAPPDQTVPFPAGGEDVVLQNVTADGHRAFRLPSRPMPMTIIPHIGDDVTRRAALDTIVFDPDHERFTMAWRLTFPLPRSIFDVRETIVGEMSLAWHRARRYPGKVYYRSLGEAVAALRQSRIAS
jgi:hypothetical protein